MTIIVSNLYIPLEHSKEEFEFLLCQKINMPIDEIKNYRVIKESIDARRKYSIRFVYTVMVYFKSLSIFKSNNDCKIFIPPPSRTTRPLSEKIPVNGKTVVVGSGPAGLFAALTLAKNGFNPLIIERGDPVELRKKQVDAYWQTGELDTESNVQFGEGGAGTFSDGKLTTRINDNRIEQVLDAFREAGIEENVLYKAKPHIGTDRLYNVLQYIRSTIISLGGTFRFRSKLTGFIQTNNQIKSIIINNEEEIETNCLILATGHSARDTYQLLEKKFILLEPKAFSIGVRIEHPQEMIDKERYGDFALHPKLGRAEYQLFKKYNDRTVYSFCMCPGGIVVGSASEENTIVTNGMSEFSRNQQNANSALVVSITPDDFEDKSPLGGVTFQREYEKKAYVIGKGSAPVQQVGDFLANKKTTAFGNVKPSYTGKTEMSDLNLLFPKEIADSLKIGIKDFDKMLPNFSRNDAIITGVETRTSSPVRIIRNEELQATNCKGFFPCGEGAGYAGGIMSAAVDGIRVAEKIIDIYLGLK